MKNEAGKRTRLFRAMLLRLGIVMSVIYATRSEELLDLTCLNENSCKQYQHSGILAACVQYQCECKESSGGQVVSCVPPSSKKNNFIGGQCPCTQPNAECNTAQDICYCAVGYAPSKDLRRCLKTHVPLDGACEQDEQCQANDAFAICNPEAKTCQCRTSYQRWADVCAAQLGRAPPPCNNDGDCRRFGAAAKCVTDSGCLCDIGYVGASNMSACLPAVELHAACKEQAQCQRSLGAAATCLHGQCACEEMHEPRPLSSNSTRLTCARKLVLGQYCRSDTHCQDASTTEHTMICDLGQCNCRGGYIAMDNSLYCQSSSAVELEANYCWLLLPLAFMVTTISTAN